MAGVLLLARRITLTDLAHDSGAMFLITVAFTIDAINPPRARTSSAVVRIVRMHHRFDRVYVVSADGRWNGECEVVFACEDIGAELLADARSRWGASADVHEFIADNDVECATIQESAGEMFQSATVFDYQGGVFPRLTIKETRKH